MGLVLTITLVAFEALAVSTVMPIVADELNGIELYGWVFTAFMLGSLIGIVLVGGLIDRRGLGGPFAAGIGLFAAGLIVGGLAPTMEVLVGARFVQGLGAGTVPPIAYVAIGRSLPEHLRPQMFATLSTAWVCRASSGPRWPGSSGRPSVGGGSSSVSCRSSSCRHRSRSRPSGRSDLTRTTRRMRPRFATAHPWRSSWHWAPVCSSPASRAASRSLLVVLGTGGAVIGLFALRRLTPEGTLRAARGLPATVLMRGVITFAFFAVDAYVALALVEWRGLSAAQAGIALTAATLSWTAGSWTQAKFSKRWPPERFVRIGVMVLVVGLASFMIVLVPTVSPWWRYPDVRPRGLRDGPRYSPLALIVLREAPPAEQGRASAAVSLTDSLGRHWGPGVTGALVAASVRATGDPAGGLAVGFAVAVGRRVRWASS